MRRNSYRRSGHTRRWSRTRIPDSIRLRRCNGVLSPRERNFLRHYFIDRLSADEIAKRYRIHRVSAARVLRRARDGIVKTAKTLFQERSGLTTSELRSILSALRSGVDVSVARLLGASDAVR